MEFFTTESTEGTERSFLGMVFGVRRSRLNAAGSSGLLEAGARCFVLSAEERRRVRGEILGKLGPRMAALGFSSQKVTKEYEGGSAMKKGAFVEPTWRNAPISIVCEVLTGHGQRCGEPTTHAYPAMGRGWMALCFEHAQKHLPSGCVPIGELIVRGETFIKREGR